MTSGVVLPVGSGHPYTSDEGNKARDEDGSTASKVVVQWCCQPATNDTTAKIGSGVNESKEPLIAASVPGSSIRVDSELRSEE